MRKENSYKDTIKSNFVFGGVKIFQVIVSILKTKVAAFFLGPSGIGLLSLFTNTLNTLHQFTTFGIFLSSVRQISKAEDEFNKKKTIDVLIALSFIVGLFGVLLCIIFSKRFSLWVFNDGKYFIGFIVVSFSLLFNSISNGLIAVFQGLRKLRVLAKGTVVGSALSVIISIPFYSFYGEKIIPLVILLGFIIISVTLFFFAKKEGIIKSFRIPSLNQIKDIGVPIIKLGTLFMLSNGLLTLFSLVLSAFINKTGGSIDVGFYHAAVTCTYGNIAILISILASDFFPRLSASLNNKKIIENILHQQLEIFVLVVTPIICIIILYPSILINVLFSKEFYSVANMVQVMSVSLIFRVVWHTLSYVVLAFGDMKSYFLYDALLGNGIVFISNILGYHFGGLNGLAITYLIGSIIVPTILFGILKYKLEVNIDKRFWIVFSISLILILLVFVCMTYIHQSIRYFYQYQLCFSQFFSQFSFTERINIISFIKNKCTLIK